MPCVMQLSSVAVNDAGRLVAVLWLLDEAAKEIACSRCATPAHFCQQHQLVLGCFTMALPSIDVVQVCKYASCLHERRFDATLWL